MLWFTKKKLASIDARVAALPKAVALAVSRVREQFASQHSVLIPVPVERWSLFGSVATHQLALGRLLPMLGRHSDRYMPELRRLLHSYHPDAPRVANDDLGRHLVRALEGDSHAHGDVQHLYAHRIGEWLLARLLDRATTPSDQALAHSLGMALRRELETHWSEAP